MSKRGALQRRAVVSASSPTRAPGARTSERLANEKRRSFDELDRAASHGHRLDAIPAHAPPLAAGKTGRPLPSPLRGRMEAAFGASFEPVRVHEDESAEALGAVAYTRGHDIHFAPGRYQPNALVGQALIGHELTHVVQQRAGIVSAPQGKGAPINADPTLEAEADQQGMRAARGEPTTVRGASTGTQPKADAGAGGVIQRFTEEEMDRFFERLKTERARDLAGVNNGFVLPRRGGMQPGPRGRAIFGLMQSRFDTSDVGVSDRENIEQAFSGATRSPTHNALTSVVAADLIGRMLRNVRRAGLEYQSKQELAERYPNSEIDTRVRPDQVEDSESAKLKVGVSRGASPHYSHTSNSISLMNPGELDQTSHELRHAYDQIHGVLDLHQKDQRIASELNAFTQQDTVARELTGRGPGTFEGRSPEQMARTYEGKVAKGYTGTLKTSLEAAEKWRKQKQKKS
jgi:hypothetical protein